MNITQEGDFLKQLKYFESKNIKTNPDAENSDEEKIKVKRLGENKIK